MIESNVELFQTIVKISLNGIKGKSPRKMRGKKKTYLKFMTIFRSDFKRYSTT